MERNIPEYSREFSLQTNNLPFPRHHPNRFKNWVNNRFNPIRRPNYERIPTSEPVAETSFSNPTETRIQLEPDQIFEISESSPLFGTTAAGGTALFGGTTSAIGTTGSAITGVLGGSTIVGGAAYGIKKLVDRVKEKGAVLPNSEYIGPGNPIPIGVAKNPSEQIAKDHDLAYSNAKSGSDILSADKEAIDRFKEEYSKSGDYYAKVGQIGLQIKTGLEKVIGVQYPRFGKLNYIL